MRYSRLVNVLCDLIDAAHDTRKPFLDYIKNEQNIQNSL